MTRFDLLVLALLGQAPPPLLAASCTRTGVQL
jgi:hypothetical protein